jgi:segregation and condensation protein B
MPTGPSSAEPADQSPLSLNRLREAFATMLGEQDSGSREQGAGTGRVGTAHYPAANDKDTHGGQCPPYAACEISPRSVAEAILFVGRPDNGTFSGWELAVAMRGVSPAEIETAVAELNARYDADATPYQIERTGAGYRLALRPEFERMRDKFYGRVREARLSPAALEVLSIVAYKQPTTAEQINQLRGAPSGAVLSTLVRRKLVRLERSPIPGEAPRCYTTDRFLRIFGLENLAVLPRSEELEKV